jgi:hypothetical protein
MAFYCLCVLILRYVSAYYCICVLILLYMCPRTTIYVSSTLTCHIYMRIHMHRGASRALAARSHFSRQLAGVSAYSCICVLILLYMCPHPLFLLHMCPRNCQSETSYNSQSETSFNVPFLPSHAQSLSRDHSPNRVRQHTSAYVSCRHRGAEPERCNSSALQQLSAALLHYRQYFQLRMCRAYCY